MYRWVEHTAELELSIDAGSEHEVLADALTALGELIDPDAGVDSSSDADAPRGGCPERRTITARARDRAALLAAWLEELVYLAEIEGFIACGLDSCALGPDDLSAVVRGRLGEPRPLVKAVTYHRLTFEPRATGYVATVVLDV